MKTFILIAHLLAYSVITAFSLAAFTSFKPFTYIDNAHSYIFCNTDSVAYEINPNFIFALDPRLDPYNDQKARKLCGPHVIMDYNNVYPVPADNNYIFKPARLQEGSWFNAIFVALIVWLCGSTTIELLEKRFLKNYQLLHLNILSLLLYLIE